MINVNFTEEISKNNQCSSCRAKVKAGNPGFQIGITEIEFFLCVDCGNELLNKIYEEFSMEGN